MTASIHCGTAVHSIIIADDRAFSSGRLLGYQQVTDEYDRPVDLVEMRDCPQCGCQISRLLGIEARLAEARDAIGGLGDQAMIGICRRALLPDPFTLLVDDSAIMSFKDALAFEALILPRTVTQSLPMDWRQEIESAAGPDRPSPSDAMRAESRTETVRMEVLRG